MSPTLVGCDSETFLIAQECLFPRMVCWSMASTPTRTCPDCEGNGSVPDPNDCAPSGDSYERFIPCRTCNGSGTAIIPNQPLDTDLIGNNDWNRLHDIIQALLADDSIKMVLQNAAYDLGVICSNFPDLLPMVFDKLSKRLVSCTMIREKMLFLATTGDLGFIEAPDGSKIKAGYGMDDIVKRRFGVDLSGEKNSPDAWRTNFGLFDNKPVEEYPETARTYAVNDSVWALAIHAAQTGDNDKLIAQRGIDAFTTEWFIVFRHFCLGLMAAWGVKTDPEAVMALKNAMLEELSPEKLNLLISTGILRPAEPARPHKKAKEHVEGCKRKECDCPPRMCSPVEESVNQTVLKEYVLQLANRLNACPECGNKLRGSLGDREVSCIQVEGNVLRVCPKCTGTGLKDPLTIKLRYTDKSKSYPNGQLQVNEDFLKEYGHLDPVLEQYQHRQKLQKIVTTEIPRMMLNGVPAPVVHPQYDPLKETGRTSSFASKSTDYASFNCQNVDPRARKCFVPRDGYLLFSIDYSQMELGTLAQTCINLFGKSVLADKINAGVDVHAFTGAQLAYAKDAPFNAHCQKVGALSQDQIFEQFLPFKKAAEESPEFKFYKHWRKFAKPVNLGYPGGLGPATMVAFARKPYEVNITEEEAYQFRSLWRETYPEMVEYFKYINTQCIDPHNTYYDADEGKRRELYCYTTPLGLHRAGCDYCACANGMGLQSPSAEGATLSVIEIVQACYNWTIGSILGPDASGPTVRPTMFIHDELVGEVRNDNLVHERLMEMKRIMIESMRLITPDVTVNANPCLMTRWDKNAEPVFGKDGRIAIWTPK